MSSNDQLTSPNDSSTEAGEVEHAVARDHMLADIDRELQHATDRIEAARERLRAADAKYSERLRRRKEIADG